MASNLPHLQSTNAPLPPFLRLPASIRQRIYTYLLPPAPSETTTYINYSLDWPWFENPSNTTFNGTYQLDLCRCPQNPQKPRTSNRETEDHIYSRFKCYGPEVRFKSAREDLWVPGDAYGSSGQINFPRPGLRWEVGDEPASGLLMTCRQVYHEAVGSLYRGRNLCFLTGPCPRGRYQAYATQHFLTRLSSSARSHVTALSIIALPYEEDANPKDVVAAYMDLAIYIRQNLSAFETLNLSISDSRGRDYVSAFGQTWPGGAEVCVGTDVCGNGDVKRCKDAKQFERARWGLRVKELPEQSTGWKDREERRVEKKGASVENPKIDQSHTRRTLRKKPTTKQLRPSWEEVQDENKTAEEMDKIAKDQQRFEPRSLSMVLRKVSKVQRVMSKQGKGKEKVGTGDVEDLKTDGDWVDATLSPTAETWEVL